MARRRESWRIAIVGGGVSGIAAAAKLTKAGFNNFTIYEKSDGVGGTWFDNVYPGCSVDVPSEVYSFSFFPYSWQRTHATQSELRRYLDEVVDYLGIRSNLHLGTGVERAVWETEFNRYRIELQNGEIDHADLVVACVGMLNDPKYPVLPGMDDFEGPMFHTARWESHHEMAGKTVAIMGTGSSSAQVVAELAKVVEKLYVFQREPGWVIPKNERLLTDEERRMDLVGRAKRRWRRYLGFWRSAERISARNVGTKKHRELTETALAHIRDSIDDPELRKLVTPDYPIGCKRIIRDSNFYRALAEDNVELVPKAVARFTKSGVVDADGEERAVDTVVLATGFKTTEYLSQVEVVGPEGISLKDHWSGEPCAYYGITVAGFPNLFIAYGPNTNGAASIIAQSERQAEVMVSVAKRMVRRGFATVDTSSSLLHKYVEWVDIRNEATASSRRAGCHNYYMSPSGRNVTQWPNSQPSYWWRTRWVPLRLRYSR